MTLLDKFKTVIEHLYNDLPLATDFHNHCLTCDKCTDGTGIFCEEGARILLILVDKMVIKHRSTCEICGGIGSDFCFVGTMTAIPELVGGIYAESAKSTKLILHGNTNAEPPKGVMNA